jgi:hypothetical protein
MTSPVNSPPDNTLFYVSTREEVYLAVDSWSEKIQVQVQSMRFRPMTRKWASISSRGNLSLNSGILSLPQELCECIIVHELVHLLVPNHSKLFKSFMHAYLPDWEAREQRLRILSTIPLI